MNNIKPFQHISGTRTLKNKKPSRLSTVFYKPIGLMIIGYLPTIGCSNAHRAGVQRQAPEALHPYVRLQRISINKIIQKGIMSKTCLHQAIREGFYVMPDKRQIGLLGLLKLLFFSNLVNEQDEDSNTPLMVATKLNKVKDVETLLNYTKNKGGDLKIDAKDKHGGSSLFIAIQNVAQQGGAASLEILKLLIENGANLAQVDLEYNTPLLFAVKCNALDALKLILETGVADKMMYSVGNSQCRVISCRDIQGKNPVLVASEKGYVEILNCLINHGADTSTFSASFDHPLLQSFLGGHTEVSKIIIEKGVDREEFLKAIALSKLAGKSDIKGMKDLIYKYGANIHFDAEIIDQPFFEAIRECATTEAMQFLIDNGVDVNAKVWTAYYMERTQRSSGCSLHWGISTTMCYIAPLHRAARLGNIEAMQLLIDNNANINIDAGRIMRNKIMDAFGKKFGRGRKPLLFREGHGPITPLFEAAIANQVAAVRFLKKAGADRISRAHLACNIPVKIKEEVLSVMDKEDIYNEEENGFPLLIRG